MRYRIAVNTLHHRFTASIARVKIGHAVRNAADWVEA